MSAVRAIHDWLLDLCVLVWLGIHLVSLGLGIVKCIHLALVSVQSCCTTQMICQLLMAQLFLVCTLFPALLWIVASMYMWHVLVVPDRASYLFYSVNIPLKQPIPEKDIFKLTVYLLWYFHICFSVCLSIGTQWEIILNVIRIISNGWIYF